MLDSYFNMQHKYVHMKDIKNKINIVLNLKNKNSTLSTCNLQHAWCHYFDMQFNYVGKQKEKNVEVLLINADMQHKTCI